MMEVPRLDSSGRTSGGNSSIRQRLKFPRFIDEVSTHRTLDLIFRKTRENRDQTGGVQPVDFRKLAQHFYVIYGFEAIEGWQFAEFFESG
jgi:hypothetical protein